MFNTQCAVLNNAVYVYLVGDVLVVLSVVRVI